MFGNDVTLFACVLIYVEALNPVILSRPSRSIIGCTVLDLLVLSHATSSDESPVALRTVGGVCGHAPIVGV